MKKSLVLAMAMALGVTASAYAANPFSDVPAGHWAYDSVNKLAAAGVVEGYPDGTFGGDKLMTRYEMAQIVARAMANGANVDKLAAEFADELDSLGVRVANLEKKADNVKVSGEVRYRYYDAELGGNYNKLRSRIYVSGQINDGWSYTGMLHNEQDFDNNNGDETTKFQRAYVQGRVGGLNVTAGRYNMVLANGNVYDTRADGVEVSYGKNIVLTGYMGKATDGTFASLYDDNGEIKNQYEETYGDYVGGEMNAWLGDNAILSAGAVKFKDMGGEAYGVDNTIWNAGLTFYMGDVTLQGMYLQGDAKGDAELEKAEDNGYVVGLSYAGAKAAEVGTWGLAAHYYDQGAQTYTAHTTDAEYFSGEGFKGWDVAADYTFAKNIIGKIGYYDTESKKDDSNERIVLGQVTFTF